MANPETDRTETLNSVEETLKEKVDGVSPKIPEQDRRLEAVVNSEGHQVGMIERIRDREEREANGREDLWLVVDFDDVINHTTTFNNRLFEQLANTSGISQKSLHSIYDQSKVPNDAGKKVFRFSQFVETVKSQSGSPAKVEQVVQGLNYDKFVDQAVKRALLAIRSQHPQEVRISILTYGDPEYQKMRIDKTDLGEMVDDVIYTEGSKRHVIEAVLQSEYGASLTSIEKALAEKGIAEIREDEPIPTDRPFVMTVDDSPEHVRDYRRVMSGRGFAHVRFRHPQAKRSPKSAGEAIEPILSYREEQQNEAAVRVYKTARGILLAKAELMQGGEEAVFTSFKSHESTDQLLERKGALSKEQIGSTGVTFEEFIRETKSEAN